MGFDYFSNIAENSLIGTALICEIIGYWDSDEILAGNTDLF
jgi:hypothetical protein